MIHPANGNKTYITKISGEYFNENNFSLNLKINILSDKNISNILIILYLAQKRSNLENVINFV